MSGRRGGGRGYYNRYRGGNRGRSQGRGSGRGTGRGRGRVNSSGISQRSHVSNTPTNHSSNTQNQRFLGWSLYFPDVDFSDDFPYLPRIRLLRRYFASQAANILEDGCHNNTVSAPVDFQSIISTPEFQGGSQCEASIGVDVREAPSVTINCMSLAMYQAMHDAANNTSNQSVSGVPHVTVRLYNYEPITQLRNLKANYIGSCYQHNLVVLYEISVERKIHFHQGHSCSSE
eukprot:m.111020 g.111020  ORF g.111020 m.111020 type:complete len:231 (-) comp14053_c0_seq11:2027-2719(-)